MRGFTLVELAIILVILGLLVGGILAGKSLIHASTLRAVLGEEQQYQAAVHGFRDRYFALPGDFTMAWDFWGTNCAASKHTCNGNGNGFWDSDGSVHEVNDRRYWVHLSLAGLIADKRWPADNVASENEYGLNNPVSKLAPGMWDMRAGWQGTGPASPAYGRYANIIWLGGRWSTGTLLIGGFMKPEDAWHLDSKRDDGMASTGKVIGANGRYGTHGNPINCVTPNNYPHQVTSAEYVVTWWG